MFSLPPGTEMFQFPGFPVPALCIQTGLTGHDPSRVSPFGNPWIYGWLTPPQGLSQFPTSFIGSWCQGIHRVLFLTCCKDCSRSLWSSQRSPDATDPGPSALRRRFPTSALAEGETLPQSCTGCPSSNGVLQPGHVLEHHSRVMTPRTRSEDSPGGIPYGLRW